MGKIPPAGYDYQWISRLLMGIPSVHGISRLSMETLFDYYYFLPINLSPIILITPLSSLNVAVVNNLIVILTSSLSSSRITSLSLGLLRNLIIITLPIATLSSYLYITHI